MRSHLVLACGHLRLLGQQAQHGAVSCWLDGSWVCRACRGQMTGSTEHLQHPKRCLSV